MINGIEGKLDVLASRCILKNEDHAGVYLVPRMLAEQLYVIARAGQLEAQHYPL